MSTQEALDALLVAHDALLEGREFDDPSAPLWTRPSRLLSAPRTRWQDASLQDYLDAMIEQARGAFGPDVSASSGTILYQTMKVFAQQEYDLHKQMVATWDYATPVDLT